MGWKVFEEAVAATEALKVTPPVTVTGAVMSGVDLNLFIQVGTLIYIGLLIVDKAWMLYKRKKEKNESSQ